MNASNNGRVRCCALLLCSASIFVFAMALAIFFLMDKVGKNDTMMMVVENGQDEFDDTLYRDMAGLMLGLTFIPIIFGVIIASCAVERCHNKPLGNLCVFLSIFVFWGFASWYAVIGDALIQPHVQGTDWVVDTCTSLVSGTFTKDYNTIEQGLIFADGVEKIDARYQESVNTKMCSEYCTCSGDGNDPHYIEYASVPEATYAKYGRSWLGQSFGNIPVVFLSGYDNYTTYASQTMKQCYDSYAAVYNYNNVTGNAQVYNDQQLTVALARPDAKFDKLATYMEAKYDCAGVCTPALFYYSQPISKGLPKEGCMRPFMDEVGPLMYDVGAIFITTSVILFLMLFCACPICCYRSYEGESPMFMTEMMPRMMGMSSWEQQMMMKHRMMMQQMCSMVCDPNCGPEMMMRCKMMMQEMCNDMCKCNAMQKMMMMKLMKEHIMQLTPRCRMMMMNMMCECMMGMDQQSKMMMMNMMCECMQGCDSNSKCMMMCKMMDCLAGCDMNTKQCVMDKMCSCMMGMDQGDKMMVMNKMRQCMGADMQMMMNMMGPMSPMRQMMADNMMDGSGKGMSMNNRF